MKHSGNTILITGGSSGFGLELAKQLVASGNQVLICGRNSQKLQAAKAAIPEINYYRCDIADLEECQKLRDWLLSDHPGLNILFNNAAIVHHEDFLSDDTVDQAVAEIDTNLIAPIRLCKLLLPQLLSNQNSAIVNISTGLVYAPRFKYTYYNATKAALHTFTQVLRAQLKSFPIEVAEILLPVIDTPWHKGNPPKIAISPALAAKHSIQALSKGKSEIRIGKVKHLYYLSRFFPGLASRIINNQNHD